MAAPAAAWYSGGMGSLRQHLWGVLIGLAITAGVVAAYGLRQFERLEMLTLDMRFRWFNRLEARPDVVHIDITDDALLRIGRWPWPRRLHAELIDTLAELGAGAIVTDIVWAEKQKPRLALPDVDNPAELEPALTDFIADDAIFDDNDLAAAVRRAGNVYLATFFELESQLEPDRRAAREIDRLLNGDPDLSLAELVKRTGSDVDLVREVKLAHRMVRKLRGQFSLGLEALARRLDADPDEVGRILAGVKKRTARGLVTELLDTQPSLSLEQVTSTLTAGVPPEQVDPLDLRDIEAAYEHARAVAAALGPLPEVPPENRDRYEEVLSITPPLEKLSRWARECSFVTFATPTDSVDAVLREVPLVEMYRGKRLRQLALAAAADRLGVDPAAIHLDGSHLRLPDAHVPGEASPRDVEVPLMAGNRLLVNWVYSSKGWSDCFNHVAVGRVLEIPFARRRLEACRDRLRLAAASAVKELTPDDEYFRLYRARRRGESARRWLDPRRPDEAKRLAGIDQRLDAIEQAMRPHEQRAKTMLDQALAAYATTVPADDDERALLAKYRDWHRALTNGPAELKALREEVDRQVAARRAELAPLIRDRVCFVGYTATAVADFVPTPVYGRLPGVMVHSNLYNTVMLQAFVHRASGWLNVLLLVGVGAVITAISAFRGPIVSVLAAAIILATTWVVALLWFYVSWVWVIAAAPTATVILPLLGVTLYRQLTEGRQRRQMTLALGQYTSPAIARQIAGDPRNRGLRPAEGEVSCFFSDLKGFTSLSEAWGPDRTRAVLNPYLGSMSAALRRHRALINKFIGDGIFAFFNAPLPLVACEDHAVRACDAALECQRALDDLKREHADGPLGANFQRLRMRIGLNSGVVFVGDYGSDEKRDYTCIGDTVNLAARLEPANKAFGTWIMVSEATRAGTDGQFAYRHLGGLQVVGKTQAVQVYELLGRAGDVDADLLGYAELFDQGIGAFQRRDWPAAVGRFEECLTRRPDDVAAQLYIQTTRTYRDTPPADDWNGAIELTEK